jgi:glycosyltransferase involved in cell wall biosynthesis
MRVVFVQYAGDYREASLRLENGGPEYYYAQRHTVEYVASLLAIAEEVAVICLVTNEAYEEVLPNGVRAIGMGKAGGSNTDEIIPIVERLAPSRLVLRFPDITLLKHAAKRGIDTIAVLADSFQARSIGNRWYNYKTARALKHPCIRWVANHNVTASKSLVRIGVSAEKIIPYDFPATISPANQSPKELGKKANGWKLFYIGELSNGKGLGDLIDAVDILNKKGLPIRLDIVGRDKEGLFATLVRSKGLAEIVSFVGLIPNVDVVPEMQKADAVIVPSRHEYPEGFPLTIYHALCSRTPLIASDHPMFLPTLTHGVNAQIFKAGDAFALANAAEELFANPRLYADISKGTLAAWERLQVPVQWVDVIGRWISGSSDDSDWLHRHRLGSGLYDA